MCRNILLTAYRALVFCLQHTAQYYFAGSVPRITILLTAYRALLFADSIGVVVAAGWEQGLYLSQNIGDDFFVHRINGVEQTLHMVDQVALRVLRATSKSVFVCVSVCLWICVFVCTFVFVCVCMCACRSLWMNYTCTMQLCERCVSMRHHPPCMCAKGWRVCVVWVIFLWTYIVHSVYPHLQLRVWRDQLSCVCTTVVCMWMCGYMFEQGTTPRTSTHGARKYCMYFSGLRCVCNAEHDVVGMKRFHDICKRAFAVYTMCATVWCYAMGDLPDTCLGDGLSWKDLFAVDFDCSTFLQRNPSPIGACASVSVRGMSHPCANAMDACSLQQHPRVFPLTALLVHVVTVTRARRIATKCFAASATTSRHGSSRWARDARGDPVPELTTLHYCQASGC